LRLNWKSSNDRCENRSGESFSLWLQVAGSEIDWLISRWNEFKGSMRESILLNYLSSKTIARFEAKFGVAKICFFVVVCYRLLICAFTDQCWFISTVMIRFKSVYCMSVVYCWMMYCCSLSSYLLSDLYVESVDHMTHTNLIRSGYHQPTWLVKPFSQTIRSDSGSRGSVTWSARDGASCFHQWIDSLFDVMIFQSKLWRYRQQTTSRKKLIITTLYTLWWYNRINLIQKSKSALCRRLSRMSTILRRRFLSNSKNLTTFFH
jgi:hypothetical protein